MATESLIVELDARTKKLEDKLDRTERKLDGLDKTTKKTSASFKNLSSTASIVGKGVLAVGAAATVAAASILAMSKAVGEYSKEIKVASQLSGIAVEKLQLMSHATATVGIGIEDLGDKSKDTREKIGDFLNTGGGGFMDFVDAMKLTKKEAREVAVEFSRLSGVEILQEMVKRMEDAEVSAVQMSHALEGMASDTTKLIPLLANGSAELNKLTAAAASVIIPLDDDDIDLFIRMGTSVDTAAASLKSLGEQELLNLGERFIEVTELITFFFASLNEGTIANKQTRLLEISGEIDTLKENIADSLTPLGRLQNALTMSDSAVSSQQQINELLEERVQIGKDLESLRAGTSGEDGGDSEGGGLIPESSDSADVSDKAIQDIKDRFKSEEELLQEKFDREVEMIGDQNELKLQLEEEYLEALIALSDAADEEVASSAAAAESKRVKQTKKDLDNEVKNKKKAELQKINTQEAAIGLGKALNESLLGDNKAVAAGLIVADTAVGIQKSLSVAPYDYVNVGIIAATGALNLANALSSSKGGGTISSGSTGGSGANSAPSQQNFEQETSSLELTDSTDSGSQSTTINFGTDSGDELIDAIASALNKAQREGRA